MGSFRVGFRGQGLGRDLSGIRVLEFICLNMHGFGLKLEPQPLNPRPQITKACPNAIPKTYSGSGKHCVAFHGIIPEKQSQTV